MILHRNYIKEYYVENGITKVTRLFDPLICWHYENGMGTIGFRGNYSIGFYWKYRVGTWSRIKTRFIRIGKLTLFIHYGECEPYNPMTGERYQRGSQMNKMSFEELVDKLASFKWDGSLDQADQFSKLIIELLTRHAELQTYKADIENAIKGAMDDNPNEKHCSCVPLLKVKIKQLEEKVKQLEVENKRLDIIVKDWVGIDNNYLNHQRQIADLEAQVEQGKRAITLVKECDEYLDSFYKINSIRTYCNLHIKMKELLQPDGLTKGDPMITPDQLPLLIKLQPLFKEIMGEWITGDKGQVIYRNETTQFVVIENYVEGLLSGTLHTITDNFAKVNFLSDDEALLRLPLAIDPVNPERGLWGMIEGYKTLNSGTPAILCVKRNGIADAIAYQSDNPYTALLKALIEQEAHND